ncbi:hypothetical protein L873DRAFT_1823771 [Choiromyces venosus 120613-1]|uniref:Uncharacterized protein n=1 Tax=Choiromyces venosus 120613-1 TaxID=1336337 RepID=A0A3N4J4X9_9PEZI|nr:hypothetical protein L873DRAFT_1823771 [Choiromyces venosus 120613-1]
MFPPVPLDATSLPLLVILSCAFSGVYPITARVLRPIDWGSVRVKCAQPKARIIFPGCTFMAPRPSWLMSVATPVLYSSSVRLQGVGLGGRKWGTQEVRFCKSI